MVKLFFKVGVIRHQQWLVDQGPFGGGDDVAPGQRRDRAGKQCEHPQFVDLDDHSPVYPEILGNGRNAVGAQSGTADPRFFCFGNKLGKG